MILFSVILVGALLAAVFFKSHRQTKQLQSIIASKNAELYQLRKTDEKLQLEFNTLQTSLQHAITDPVTHLQGSGLFEDRVNHSIHESARYQFTMAVLYIDINDFKVINEALGYATGDAVLNVVAQRLQACIRKVDNMSRFSKDLFVILLTQLGKPETAAVIAQRILESLTQPVQVKEHKLYITASIGISIYPSDGLDAAALFRNADLALLLAKEKGCQNYQFYQEKIHANSLRELALATGLKRDSLMSEFEIYYQPIMNTQTKSIFCMEVLLYWHHPELGLINPEELYTYSEKHGKSNIIFEWLLKQASQRFVQWRTVGFQPELLGISLSIRQLNNSQFIYRISQILQECDFKPEWLLIEIKGNLSQTSFDIVEKSFNMLSYLNIKLAIDHFGSGLFSIQDLKKFAVNYLKLDQSLISDVQQNEQTKELVKAMLVLAKSLSMRLIVQGVDSEQQMMTLRELGCDFIQGEFAGAAVPEKEVVTSTVASP